MATEEQREASGKVIKAVEALNEALGDAGRTGLHIELKDIRWSNTTVPRYQVEMMETREAVAP